MAWNTEQITEVLLEAGQIAQRLKDDMRFELKGDRSIVTQADREIEGLFARAFERPEGGTFLIGEETVGDKGERYIEKALKGECYVVDPIDGTAPYAHRLPVWGISVGRMECGVLTDGAVFLPDMGELVLSDGERVVQGTLRCAEMEWSTIEDCRPVFPDYGLVSITQGVAKRGKVLLPNPVLVLGTAVVPMVGLLQGRFLAYLGSVKLWDVAGALPLLMRKGFSATVRAGDEIRAVTARVEERTYQLDPGSRARWSLRGDLLICRPEDQHRLRTSFASGDP